MSSAAIGPENSPNSSSCCDPLAGLRVLVVEDEPMILMALEDILTDLGCEIVAAATSHRDALKAAKTADFELAILDVTLGSDKIDDVAHLISASNRPIVYATGCTPHEVTQRFGPNSTAIDKPYTLATVSAGLHHSLATSRSSAAS